MNKKYRILVLTDHSGHTDQNSIYALLNEMVLHPQCTSISVASRGLVKNGPFFQNMEKDQLYGSDVDSSFRYSADGRFFQQNLRSLDIDDFNLVFLRLPRPISDEFLYWLSEIFKQVLVINNPRGIIHTSNKKYLLSFPEICPDPKWHSSIQDILLEAEKHPIVLKPLKEYGGKGILKIDQNILDDGKNIYDADTYLKNINNIIVSEGFLSMKYLKNVSQGDKRILVVNGEILASSLRMPAKDSWLCNVAQGGTSVPSTIAEEEIKIVERINPSLRKEGIFLYGVDTLLGDDGKRLLSEINTLSIGGFPQAAKQSKNSIIHTFTNKLFNYADEWSN